jgi:hypothetical protein
MPDMITDTTYEEAKQLCEEIASNIEEPRFYREKACEVDHSRQLFENHALVRKFLEIVAENKDTYGHGLSHVRKVSIDCGAIIMIEGTGRFSETEMQKIILHAHLAGVLHDIKRKFPDHAREGAKEAGKILRNFNIGHDDRTGITLAIENHEAFKSNLPLDNPVHQLLSDALYDADKFRWGPDNFTEMLWDIIVPQKVPLKKVIESFTPGLEATRRIRDIFRSRAGKTYGPDFIDKGLLVGEKFYRELKARLHDGTH